ncbi:MAG: pyridoxal-phosphate dependent enzyme [Candidatus Cloacimonadota bacterium]|nr:pyridoxal-phosphate dependent enzyme [Candidatus Cloacimonadota bacterium]
MKDSLENKLFRENKSNPNSSYFYKCSTCKKKWKPDFIEQNDHYLCPDCYSQNELGMPLKGVLQVFYDYEFLKSKYSKGFFETINPGNIFLYPDLLPLKSGNDFSLFSSLQLPSHSLHKIQKIKDNQIFLLDETHNPTFSYKDRASVLVAAKAIELDKKTICTASTGNAATSLAGICARLGLKSKIFVPKSIPKEKLLQLQIYGAGIIKVDGTYDDTFDLAIEKSQKNGWYNRNTAYNSLTIEGKKSGAFDIFMQMNYSAPDIVFVPSGDGVILAGIYKGFYDLLQLDLIKKIPQIIATQAEGSSAIVDFLNTGEFILKSSKTVADSISVDAPRNLYLAADCIQKSKGNGIKITDNEILKAEKYLGKNLGIFVEPSAAAAWAGFKKYINQNNVSNKKIVILLTGCGLKDSKSAEKAVSLPI